MRKKRIYYVVGSKDWVHYKKVDYFRQYINDIKFTVLTKRQFKVLWILGVLKGKKVFFSTWRISRGLEAGRLTFKESDYKNFGVAITSHTNIGGGLDPLNPIPLGAEPEAVYQASIAYLKQFTVVTVNSLILKELVSQDLPEIFYCPNGVDSGFYQPIDTAPLPDSTIKVGWVGKIREAKNFTLFKEAMQVLEKQYDIKAVPLIVTSAKDKHKNAQQMREYYQCLDYYICTSMNEGTPNPALEAGACGTPIITTLVGNMRELIKHGVNGYFIEPTIDSIVNLFEKEILNNDLVKQESLSRSIRSDIELNWQWKDNVKFFKKSFHLLTNE